MVEDRILTVEEAAEILQVSAATVRRLCKNNVIPAFAVGARYRISHNALLKAVQGG